MALPATLALSPLRSLARSLARSLLDNKVTCLAAQISFVCDAIFFWQLFPLTLLLDVNPQTRDPYADCTAFLVFFFPTSRSRSQLIISVSKQ
jgi:hypothetical protein